MAIYKLDWLYNILGEMQEHPRAILTSVYNQIKNEIRTLQRDDDRAGELEEYLTAMFYVYVETLDEQDRWRNNPNDINGVCQICYAEREGFLKHLISAVVDIKRTCHVEVSREFIEQWCGYTSKRGNRLPDEQLVKIAPLTAANKTNEAAQIPAELSSDDAQAILKRAVDAGLCEQEQGGRYKWLKSIQMLAYFAVKASDYLELTNRQYNGNYVTQWQPFATIFSVDAKKLSRAKQDYQKGSNDKPKGYEAIDALFDKA